MPNKIRVLVVDDSAFFRRRITHILSSDERIEVIGTAGDGKSGVDQALRLKPDVVTMDVEMPVMDGITAVKQIMAKAPASIMMLSSHTSEGAKATLDALSAGALDFIPKPTSASPDVKEKFAAKLISRVVAMGSKVLRTPAPQVQEESIEIVPRAVRKRERQPTKRGNYKLVVIGASTGGPVAIQQLICSLPSNFNVPIVLVVHMPASFTKAYAERLNSISKLNVKEAENGDLLKPGSVFLAPGGRQLSFRKNGGELALSIRDGSVSETYKPSVDITFESAAQTLRDSVLAVVLTGMGSDGSHGATLLKQCNATVWSQDEASCVIYGMPQAVEKKGLSDLVLPLDQIGPSLAKAV
jgi:two-component system chemotaxis response regulator CheB